MKVCSLLPQQSHSRLRLVTTAELALRWRLALAAEKEKCANLNHSRLNAPIRFCPFCGELVNRNMAAQKCSSTEHSKRLKQREKFCVDCGTSLN